MCVAGVRFASGGSCSLLPRWAIPVVGATLVTALVGIWLTSALWFFTTY